MTEPIPYEHAFPLCERMLSAAAVAVATMWAHIIWIHHNLGKRLDKVAEHMMRSDHGRSSD